MGRTQQTLNVKLQVINNVDSHPLRVFTLKAPTYAIRVGRGSKSGSKELFPDRHNSWFESRVMSREHAIFKADPESKHFYIEDVGSMHGTYVEGRKIRSHEREALFPGDLIRFGAEVTRGPESFPPLEVVVVFEWMDDKPLCIPNAPKMSYSRLPGMTFTCPEYIEDDDDEEDDEVEFLHESTCAPKIEAFLPHRTYAVPESDISCAGSFTSEEASSEPHTPETSALMLDSPIVAGPSGLSEAEKLADEKALSLSESSPSARNTSSRAYSAADLFRAVNDEKLDSQNSQLSSKSQDNGQGSIGTTPTQRGEKTAFDHDLTESDSDSEDDYSPGLWVDDSEADAQDDQDREIAEDSQPKDDENEFKDDNHGAKLTEFAALGGKTAAELIFVHDPKSPMSLCDVMRGAEEGCHTELPYSFGSGATYVCISGSAPASQVGQNAASASAIRAPSPSDAAMMKPSEPAASLATLSTSGLACPPPACAFRGSSITDCTPDHDVTWPNRSALWGESNPFAKQTPSLASPTFIERSSSSNDETSAKRSSFVCLQDGDIVCGRMSRGPECNNSYWDSVLDTHDKTPTRPEVEKITEESEHNGQLHKLKRKAEDISTDKGLTDLWDAGSIVGKSVQETNAVPVRQAVFSDPISQVSITSLLVQEKSETQASIATVDERPKKRAKTSNSIAKYAAIAVASAVVGSVGTIAALVSLPSDFFV